MAYDFIEKIHLSESDEVCEAFLKGLFSGLFSSFAKYGEHYKNNEYPFFFTEKAIGSHIASAISKMTDIHLSEVGLQPNDGQKRFADFWCLINGVGITLEIKHDKPYMHNIVNANELKEEEFTNALEARFTNKLNDVLRQADQSRNGPDEFGDHLKSVFGIMKHVSIGILIFSPQDRQDLDGVYEGSDSYFDTVREMSEKLCGTGKCGFYALMPLNVVSKWNRNGEKISQLTPCVGVIGQVFFGESKL